MSVPLSISQAADELDLDPSRVRALVAAGKLDGYKVGNRWLVDRQAVYQRKSLSPSPGRPFEPHNAWALIFLGSGLGSWWLDPSSRSRLRRALKQDGLLGLRSRLGRRADVVRFSAHPGELAHLLADPEVMGSGISAASGHELELVSGAEVDGYVKATALDGVRERHALLPALPGGGNAMLRVVPDQAWHLDSDGHTAPFAAVALDLADDPDPRSASAGLAALGTLDEELGVRAKIQGEGL